MSHNPNCGAVRFNEVCTCDLHEELQSLRSQLAAVEAERDHAAREVKRLWEAYKGACQGEGRLKEALASARDWIRIEAIVLDSVPQREKWKALLDAIDAALANRDIKPQKEDADGAE